MTVTEFTKKLQESFRLPDEEFMVRTFDQEEHIIHVFFTYYGLSIHIKLLSYESHRLVISCRDWNTDYERPIYDGFSQELNDELVQFTTKKIKDWVEPQNVIERLFPPYIKRTIAYISTLADNYF